MEVGRDIGCKPVGNGVLLVLLVMKQPAIYYFVLVILKELIFVGYKMNTWF